MSPALAVRRPQATAPPPRFIRPPADVAKEPRPAPEIAKPSTRWTPPSTLKFSLHAADVTARFEIHEGTSRVTVTMLDRNTGEVLNEVPNRHVLDQIAALESTGLKVDASS